MNSNIWKIVGGFGAGLIIGSAAGYVVARKRAEQFFAQVAWDEIESVKEQYQLLRKEDIVDAEEIPDSVSMSEYTEILSMAGYSGDPEDLSKMYAQGIPVQKVINDILNQVAEMSEEEVDENLRTTVISDEVIELAADDIHNIFDVKIEEVEDDFEGPEFAEMVAGRDKSEPYVIHINEFMDECAEYQKISVRYFEGDDTLVDEANKVIPDIERLVGSESLTKFGKFSQDSEVVYVRNDRNNIDFEIMRDPASYIEKVLGVKDHVPVRKMRGND